jgi:hypothetical protein
MQCCPDKEVVFMNLKELKRELPYKERKGPSNTTLAYIDARQVMDLLDEVVGPENWQTDYKDLNGKIYCGIAIRTNQMENVWVWKWDMGTESEYEAEKGEASDAFKRAAVKWGIGRFLYDLDTKTVSTKERLEKESTVSWKTKKPTEEQVKAMLKIASYRKDIKNVTDAEALKRESSNWTAGQVSDYIGNKVTLDELRETIDVGDEDHIEILPIGGDAK